MQTAGEETKPLPEMDGPKLLHKPFRRRYLVFNLPASHGLSACSPLKQLPLVLEMGAALCRCRRHHFSRVIKRVNQRERLFRYTWRRSGKTQK